MAKLEHPKKRQRKFGKVDVDEILPAIVPERDKECDVTASEQTRKKTTWSMLDRVMLGVLE